MIAHLGNLLADQGFPIPGHEYEDICNADYDDGQFYDFGLDMDLGLCETPSPVTQEVCLPFSSPEGEVLSSEPSPSRVEVGVWGAIASPTVVAPGCDIPPRVPGAVHDPIDKLAPKTSGDPIRKKCAVRKGDGPDARDDPAGRDHYQYDSGHFYAVLTGYYGSHPPASFVLGLCKFAADEKSDIGRSALRDEARRTMGPANRFVKRRLACGYGWLDENIGPITQGEFVQAYLLKIGNGGKS
jgi:hypothetical protein